MNKENKIKELTLQLDDISISERPRRVTRSTSILQQPNKFLEKEKKERKITSKKTEKIENSKEKEKIEQKEKEEPKELFSKVVVERGDIVGRDKEISEITDFLTSHFESGENANLYVSGSPGTGKTAVVTTILESLQNNYRMCRFHLVTCMDFSSPTGVYLDLWSKLSLLEESSASRAATKIEGYLSKGKRGDSPLVFVFDEVDQLAGSKQRILYRIFKWAELAKCRLIIIGIANTLDLTECQLSDMALDTYRPHHMNFPPYQESEIAAIIMSRVEGRRQLSASEMAGVTLCSKKISAKSGDIRVALDLYKRATAISEDDQIAILRAAESTDTLTGLATPLKKVLSTPQLVSLRRSQFATPSSPCVKHVNKAIKEIEKISNPYKNIVNAETGQSILPLHHKLVLCAALVLSKQKKSTKTLSQLEATYCKVCQSQGLEALEMSDLINICDLLECRALMRVKAHKEVRQRTFILNLDEGGIESALLDNALLSSVMNKFCPQ